MCHIMWTGSADLYPILAEKSSKVAGRSWGVVSSITLWCGSGAGLECVRLICLDSGAAVCCSCSILRVPMAPIDTGRPWSCLPVQHLLLIAGTCGWGESWQISVKNSVFAVHVLSPWSVSAMDWRHASCLCNYDYDLLALSVFRASRFSTRDRSSPRCLSRMLAARWSIRVAGV